MSIQKENATIQSIKSVGKIGVQHKMKNIIYTVFLSSSLCAMQPYSVRCELIKKQQVSIRNVGSAIRVEYDGFWLSPEPIEIQKECVGRHYTLKAQPDGLYVYDNKTGILLYSDLAGTSDNCFITHVSFDETESNILIERMRVAAWSESLAQLKLDISSWKPIERHFHGNVIQTLLYHQLGRWPR